MKKTIIIITTLTLLGGKIFAQAPGLIYKWAKGIGGGNGHEYGQAIAVDGKGNAYITGRFSDTVDFDPGAGTANLTSKDGFIYEDIFLAKYDANGNYIYAIGMGGTSNDEGYGIAVDTGGNAYITGALIGTVDFDPGTGKAELCCSGNFLAKYDANGNYVYAKKIGKAGSRFGQAVAVDASGNAYVTGHFTGNEYPGTGTKLTSSGSSDIFLAKYGVNGNLVFAKSMGGTSVDLGLTIAVDADGNAYVTGRFSGTADFDPGSGTANITSIDSSNLFIAKYDANGNYVYVKSIKSLDDANGIAVDASGNTYITGTFEDTVDFNPGADTANLFSLGKKDIFLAKYDANGNYVYAKNIGGREDDLSYAIAIDAGSNIYITGYFLTNSTPADFDPGADKAYLYSSPGGNTFIAKYDANGNYVYANTMGYKAFSMSGNSEGYGIAVNNSDIYITGIFAGGVDFKISSGGMEGILTSAGNTGRDIFIAKYSENPTGIEEAAAFNAAVYPNPNNGLFRITADIQTSDAVYLQLFSTIGGVVHSEVVLPMAEKIEKEIALRNIAPGVYVLQLVAEGKVYCKRLVVE